MGSKELGFVVKALLHTQGKRKQNWCIIPWESQKHEMANLGAGQAQLVSLSLDTSNHPFYLKTKSNLKAKDAVELGEQLPSMQQAPDTICSTV